jgi:hypothetical protein
MTKEVRSKPVPAMKSLTNHFFILISKRNKRLRHLLKGMC